MFEIVILLILSSTGLLNGQLSLSSVPCRTFSRAIDPNTHKLLRIVGGLDATRGSFPYIASLTRHGGHYCGATILNEQWLITAAHCICNGFGDIMPAKRIKAVLGLHKISEWKSDTTNDNSIDDRPYEMSIQNAVVHPEYDCKRPDNDIAMLQMSRPIEFSSSVQPMCIASSKMNGNTTYESASVTIAGWGNIKEELDIGNRADTLQKAVVKVWNNQECQASFDQMEKNRKINPTQMCAGKKVGGIDACWADSGGPMIFDNHLIGIVSTGIGCARVGLPGIYTRVSSYTNWIENVIFSS